MVCRHHPAQCFAPIPTTQNHVSNVNVDGSNPFTRFSHNPLHLQWFMHSIDGVFHYQFLTETIYYQFHYQLHYHDTHIQTPLNARVQI